ncbi:MAG: hypothetical protein MHPSP_000655 [Paramarteilia canceri]
MAGASVGDSQTVESEASSNEVSKTEIDFSDKKFNTVDKYFFPTMSLNPSTVENVRRNAYIEAMTATEMGTPVNSFDHLIKILLFMLAGLVFLALMTKGMILLKFVADFLRPVLSIAFGIVDTSVQMITPPFLESMSEVSEFLGLSGSSYFCVL